MEKQALIERLVRLGATDVPGTPRLLMRHRGPQELRGLQSGVEAGIGKLQAPFKRGLDRAANLLPAGKLQGLARKAGNLAIENPEILPMQALPIPGLTPAWLAAKKGLERGIDKIAPLAKQAAGAPTRGGFMQASDIPPYRPPRLDQAIQKDSGFAGKKEKDGDALPDGVYYGGGGFRPVNINAKHAYSMPTEKMAEFVEGLLKEAIPGLTPQSRLEQSSSIGAPRASAPPGPSISQIAKPNGPGFGSGIAGAQKSVIGGGSVGGIGAMKPMPSVPQL